MQGCPRRAEEDTISLGKVQAAPLSIVYRPIGQLRPHDRNPRTHSKKQIRQIADSIKSFGFTNPVLLDETGRIIAGHGRVEAAKLLGMSEVPTIRLSEMSEAQKRAYVIADNKLAENAGWDRGLLKLELETIIKLDSSFDLKLTGFDIPAIDLVLNEGCEQDEEEVLAINVTRPAVTRVGDLWVMGEHRLLCGDAREPGDYAQLMDGEKARMAFTDPPYNVPIAGHVCGRGAVKHEDFAMATGEMDEDQFRDFLEQFMSELARHSLPGSIHFICMDWRHLKEVIEAGRCTYSEQLNLCVWNKSNAGMGSLYRSKHELILVFKNGEAPHINNVDLGKHGRNRSNVWDYPGISALGGKRMEQLSMHPTVKPVALVADAIKDCSHRRDVILDPFMGSGTTIVAAEKTGRRAYGIELHPTYVDTAVQRWEKLTGEAAIEQKTGVTFEELARDRQENRGDQE